MVNVSVTSKLRRRAATSPHGPHTSTSELRDTALFNRLWQRSKLYVLVCYYFIFIIHFKKLYVIHLIIPFCNKSFVKTLFKIHLRGRGKCNFSLNIGLLLHFKTIIISLPTHLYAIMQNLCQNSGRNRIQARTCLMLIRWVTPSF